MIGMPTQTVLILPFRETCMTRQPWTIKLFAKLKVLKQTKAFLSNQRLVVGQLSDWHSPHEKETRPTSWKAAQ